MQDAAVKTVDQVAAISRISSGRGEAGVELADLAGGTGLAKPTAHRPLGAIAAAMNAIGVVVRDEAGEPAAALSLPTIRDRVAPDRLARLGAEMRSGGRAR